MATKSEMVAEWAKKAEELRDINSAVETAKVKLAEVNNEIESVVVWKQEQLKEIEEKQKQLEIEREAFEASVDRTHLKLAMNVDELNDLIIERQEFLSILDNRITLLKASLDKLETYKIDLIANMQNLKAKELHYTLVSLPGLQTQINEAKELLASIKKARDKAVEAYENAVKGEAELARRERDLKINEIRIRNYFKKANLILPE